MRWGILSTGTIAKNFAQTAGQMPDVQMQAVASRSRESAEAFAKAYDIPTAHDSYEALANDPNVEIVYVATPHSRHAEDMKLLIQAGKHVLCEKSFTIDAKQAKEIFALAQEKHVFVMEAFGQSSSRCIGRSRRFWKAESWAKSARSRRSTAIPRRGRHASLTRRWQAARCWISACMPSALPA